MISVKKGLFSLLFFTLLFAAVYAAEPVTPTGIPLSGIGNRIDELVAGYMHEGAPGLAVAVVKDGEIVFSRGYGFADVEKQIYIDPAATVFEYGSISKMFVYISVMQLVEQGLLNLDADIHSYLPEDYHFEKTFTIRHLLNHSAGFGEFFFNAFRDAEKVEKETTLLEGLLNAQPPQIFEPGAASSYSNFGNALLAYVVSRISGQEYSVFERQNILVPLGMNHTKNQPDWFKNRQFLQSKAKGYQPDGSGGFKALPWWYIPIYPAGAINGTAEDLAQLAIALTPPCDEPCKLFNGRSTLDLMLSPSYSDPKTMRGMYHGFFRYDGAYPTFGHGGGTGGFSTEFAIVPSERFGVVLLTNSNLGMLFHHRIYDLLLGNSMADVSPSASNLPDASTVQGNYVMLRRHEGNMLAPLNFLLGTNMRVNAIDENTITLHWMNLTFTYRQTEPYFYRLISVDGAFANAMYELYFKMENGRPAGISISAPFDATVQTFRQSVTAFAVGMAIAVGGILFFLITPIILLIKFLRKKDKKTTVFNHLTNCLLFSGTLFALNFLVMILTAAEANVFIQTSMITPHVWVNYVLLALESILFIASLMFLKKAQKRKPLYFSTVTVLALFIMMMWEWNYFVMM